MTQTLKKIKKGDEVKVVVGKDKGKTGIVEKVFSSIGKVLIPNINQYKRHVKGRAQNQRSEIVAISKPLPVANVALLCPKCHLQTRAGFLVEDGKKARICRKCKQVI